MNPTRPAMSGRLTPEELDLLTAAFLHAAAACDAWQRWRAGIDWNAHLPQASFALLPLVQRNLSALGHQDSLFPRLKGIGRQAWLANQRLLTTLAPTLAALRAAGVEPLLLPPAALLLDAPTTVLDGHAPLTLVVPPKQAESALRALLGAGWQPRDLHPPRWSLAGFTHGARHLLLIDAARRSLDLSWGLDWWFGDGSDMVWTRCRTLMAGRQPIRALTATDALCSTLRADPTAAPFDALARVLNVAATAGAVDWSRVAALLATHPARTLWCDLLGSVAPLLDQWNAPATLCNEVSQDSGEATTGRIPAAPIQRHALSHRLRADLSQYRQAIGTSASAWTLLTQLPGYLIGRWHLRGIRDLPRRLLRWLRWGSDGRLAGNDRR